MSAWKSLLLAVTEVCEIVASWVFTAIKIVQGKKGEIIFQNAFIHVEGETIFSPCPFELELVFI